MDLKFRVSLFFSLVFASLLACFSVYVYSQLRNKLISGAEASLSATLEHEWRHLELHNGHQDHNAETLHTKDVYLRIWKDGKLLRDISPKTSQSAAFPMVSDSDKIVRRTERRLNGSRYEIVAYYDLTALLTYLATLARVLVLGGLLSVILILPFGWALTRSLLRPFRELSQKTRELDAEKLSFRFPAPRNRDEYGVLVANINSLLSRLERSFSQARRFAAHASHELRTPLTVIRGEAELMLRRERAPGEYQTGFRSVLKQAEHLQGMVSRLLFLADLERMEQEKEKIAIDVRHAVDDAVRSLRAVHAGHAGETKTVEILDAKVSYVGHPELFTCVIGNLIDNAFKYCDARVRVHFERDQLGLHFTVEDDGCGIPEAQRELVLEAFAKLPTQRRVQGHGLGLSIVKACVQTAGGQIELGSSALGGLSVEVFLPDPIPA